MKVKKKYNFIIGTTLGVSLIIAIGVFLVLVLRFKSSFQDNSLLIKSGISFNYINNNDIEDQIVESQKSMDIIHYELHINLLPKDKKLIGKAIITGISDSKLMNAIELNFNDGFDINKVSLNGKSIKYLYSNDKISIMSEESRDTFRIEINYDGTPENLGFGSFTFGLHKNKPVVYSLNEPIFASTWFPCNDIPSDKALTDIYITNDSAMTSVSNGILLGTELMNGKKSYHWRTMYPISTYLISIYSANYKYYNEEYISKNNEKMKIEYYVFNDDLAKAKKDFDFHPIAIKYFSDLFGEYPFIKEKYGVAEFLWNYGAMEHQTITGIGSNFISGKQFFTGMLVHELAHQWWGDAVTLKTWKDIWLNEGFATYSEALYWEKESGSASLRSTMRSFLTNFDGTKLYNPDRLFDRVIYNKGAWVLHMLRRELGDTLFFTILREYYKKYKYKNASTENFIDVVENVSNKDFTKFFDQWVYQGEGKIELEYNYLQRQENSKFIVDLVISQIQESRKNYEFILDLDFYLDNGTKQRDSIRVNERNSNFSFILNNRVTKIDLDPDNWIAAEIKFQKHVEN